ALALRVGARRAARIRRGVAPSQGVSPHVALPRGPGGLHRPPVGRGVPAPPAAWGTASPCERGRGSRLRSDRGAQAAGGVGGAAGGRGVSLSQVGGRDLDQEHTLTAVADHVELLRATDGAGHRLAISTALARHDGSHLSPCASTLLEPAPLWDAISRGVPRLCHRLRAEPGLTWHRDPAVARLCQGLEGAPGDVAAAGAGWSRTASRLQSAKRKRRPAEITRAPKTSTTPVTEWKRSTAPPKARSGRAMEALMTVKTPPKIRPRDSSVVPSWRTVKEGIRIAPRAQPKTRARNTTAGTTSPVMPRC